MDIKRRKSLSNTSEIVKTWVQPSILELLNRETRAYVNLPAGINASEMAIRIKKNIATLKEADTKARELLELLQRSGL